MNEFAELGATIEAQWRDSNFDDNRFPPICVEALRAARIPDKLTAYEVIEWTLRQDVLPVQQDLRGSFGDPPITVYNGSRFYIDVYFWLNGTTSIHQHGFCGAFQVLLGSSLHSQYEFALRREINAAFRIGDINLARCELLTAGEVRPIAPGAEYIHSLFHLDNPSATIVVRTRSMPAYQPQYDYRKPWLAVDPFFENEHVTKKLQCLSAMLRAGYSEAERYVSEWLARADFQTSYLILLNIQGHFQMHTLEQTFGLDSRRAAFDSFLKIVRERHGEIADVLPRVFEHQSRIRSIVDQRSFVNDPEHRFFLALLMNVEGRSRIFELIRNRFPDCEPIEKVLDWTLDLSTIRVFGSNIPNALGVAEFEQLDLFVLECLLKDMTDEAIAAELRSEYGPEVIAVVESKLLPTIEKLKNAPVFAPLLVS